MIQQSYNHNGSIAFAGGASSISTGDGVHFLTDSAIIVKLSRRKALELKANLEPIGSQRS
uniref:Uncharacterized protein n=1 Tax=Oryza meridionalis TaxID=40149 RepID=A0A0E0F4R4_9ORYZ